MIKFDTRSEALRHSEVFNRYIARLLGQQSVQLVFVDGEVGKYRRNRGVVFPGVVGVPVVSDASARIESREQPPDAHADVLVGVDDVAGDSPKGEALRANIILCS